MFNYFNSGLGNFAINVLWVITIFIPLILLIVVVALAMGGAAITMDARGFGLLSLLLILYGSLFYIQWKCHKCMGVHGQNF